MSREKALQSRSDSSCELCSTIENLEVFEIPESPDSTADSCLLICQSCSHYIHNQDNKALNHWRCLNDSMWSEIPAVKVMVWRLLMGIRQAGWPQDLLDMLYLDEKTLTWAQAMGETKGESTIQHLDSNGARLTAGDTISLIKDLNVKGAGFTAKRGTVVRGISLVDDNPEQIEGKINGQQIVILTKFIKKIA